MNDGFFRDRNAPVCYNPRSDEPDSAGTIFSSHRRRIHPMKSLKLALSALLVAGASAALPSSAQAQYPGGPYGGGAGANTAAAESRRQIKDAEAEVTRIRNDMNKIKQRVSAKFEGKEEWETAQKNLKAAQAAYDAATKKATAALQASPEYKAAKAKRLKAEQTIAAAGAKDAKANPKDLDKAQQDQLDAGLALRKLESDALQGDAKVAETKEKLAEAKKAWEALQDELKEALQQDETYVAAEQELEVAQANVQQVRASAAQQAASDRQARRAQMESSRQQRPGSRGGRSGGGGGY
jgi:chromosome segregation ATPase